MEMKTRQNDRFIFLVLMMVKDDCERRYAHCTILSEIPRWVYDGSFY